MQSNLTRNKGFFLEMLLFIPKSNDFLHQNLRSGGPDVMTGCLAGSAQKPNPAFLQTFPFPPPDSVGEKEIRPTRHG